MKPRFVALPPIAAALILVGATSAVAAPMTDDGVIDSGVEVHRAHQHGAEDGHLPASRANVDRVARLRLTSTAGGIADVGAFRGYAYLNAWEEECPNAGVHVVDISDPATPSKVGFIPANKNSYPGEGIHVLHVDTRFFTGDVLLHNNESCTASKPYDGGISLWNVTNPRAPRPLARGVGDFDRTNPRVEHPSPRASESHSVFAWDAGDHAYAVLVDNEEAADVDILDISKPWAPVHIAEFNLNERFPQIVQPGLGSGASFLHDMVVKNVAGRRLMLLSYWDGGYVVLDVGDPRNPVYVADSDFTDPDPEAAESGLLVEPEGNAHQAEFSKDDDFIVAADEDFSPYSVIARNTSDDEEFDATQGSNTPQIDADTSLAADTVFVGRACNGDAAVPTAPATPSASQVAVVERGVCTFTEKVANVERAGGYEGVIIFNRQGSDACTGLVNMSVEGSIPALFVSRPTGFDFFDVDALYDDALCRAEQQPFPASVTLGTVGDAIDVRAIFDGWGYAHLYRAGAGKLVELDTYAIPQAHDPAFASGFGDLSVHEVAMSHGRNDLAYFSYYSAGFRVARIQGDRLVETGHFIDEGGSNFWGVEVLQHAGTEYVLASDRDFGLYVFRYTGAGAA